MRTHHLIVTVLFLCLSGCTAPNPNLVPGDTADAQPDGSEDVQDERVSDVDDRADGSSDAPSPDVPESDTGANDTGDDATPEDTGSPDIDDGDADTDASDGDADPDTDTDTDTDNPDVDPACSADLCPDPSPRCSDNTATVQTWAGACDDGACLYDTEETECAAGCCEGGCCEVLPANIGRFGRIQETGRTMTAPVEFHTVDDCRLDGPMGVCAVVEPAQGTSACVCRVDDLTIGDLRVDGRHALVILASGSVLIQGEIDISAEASAAGPGARPAYTAEARGRDGGSGASYATRGGNSPSMNISSTYGSPNLEPLVAGANGQSACEVTGGGGGGALQITAAVALDLRGDIHAGGGGGSGGNDGLNCNGGAGGGSGGSVLLEAPEVHVSGTIWAAGGAGGSGGVAPGNDSRNGQRGEDASPSRNPAEGGEVKTKDSCGFDEISSGGGGYGAVGGLEAGNGGGGDFQRCVVGQHGSGAGGGGGALGRVRINSLHGCDCGGNVEPNASMGQLDVR